MPVDSNVVRLPVRRRAPEPDPVAYDINAVDGSVMVVVGEVELWFTPEDAIRFGTDLVSVGAAAAEGLAP